MAEVFISYSQLDKDFVRRLGDELLAHKREAWVDWKDIPLTAEWQQEIFSNIEAADNFIFIISPDSIASINCKKEIDHAVANHKRMVPIFYRTVPDDGIPDTLGRFQRLARGGHLSQCAQAKWSKEEPLYPHRQLPRAGILRKLAMQLELPKLNFQVLRRTMATLAQTKGGVKDVQGVLGHSKADTTVNVYMQPIEAGVKQTLDAIYSELTTPKVRAAC